MAFFSAGVALQTISAKCQELSSLMQIPNDITLCVVVLGWVFGVWMNSDIYESCTILFLSPLRAQAHLWQKGPGVDSINLLLGIVFGKHTLAIST